MHNIYKEICQNRRIDKEKSEKRIEKNWKEKRKIINETLIDAYNKKITVFINDIKHNPIILKEEKKFKTTREILYEETSNRILPNIDKKKNNKNNKKLNENRDIEKVHVKADGNITNDIKNNIERPSLNITFQQPSMRFKARTVLERIIDNIEKNTSNYINKDGLKEQIQKIGLIPNLNSQVNIKEKKNKPLFVKIRQRQSLENFQKMNKYFRDCSDNRKYKYISHLYESISNSNEVNSLGKDKKVTYSNMDIDVNNKSNINTSSFTQNEYEFKKRMKEYKEFLKERNNFYYNKNLLDLENLRSLSYMKNILYDKYNKKSHFKGVSQMINKIEKIPKKNEIINENTKKMTNLSEEDIIKKQSISSTLSPSINPFLIEINNQNEKSKLEYLKNLIETEKKENENRNSQIKNYNNDMSIEENNSEENWSLKKLLVDSNFYHKKYNCN